MRKYITTINNMIKFFELIEKPNLLDHFSFLSKYWVYKLLFFIKMKVTQISLRLFINKSIYFGTIWIIAFCLYMCIFTGGEPHHGQIQSSDGSYDK